MPIVLPVRFCVKCETASVVVRQVKDRIYMAECLRDECGFTWEVENG